MASDNSFKTTVDSLFKGMDSFITTKTVVGEAITVGDTIILPLIDVSFGGINLEDMWAPRCAETHWIFTVLDWSRAVSCLDISKELPYGITCGTVHAGGIQPVLLLNEYRRGQKKTLSHRTRPFLILYALSTLPLLKQEVQTYIFFAAPFAVFTLTDLMLDFHILFYILWELLTLFPK